MSIIYILTYDIIMIVCTTYKIVLPADSEYDVVSIRADVGIVRYVKYDFVTRKNPGQVDFEY